MENKNTKDLLTDINLSLSNKCDYISEAFPNMLKEINKARNTINETLRTLNNLNDEFDNVIILNLNNEITSNGKQGMEQLKQIYNTIDKSNKSEMDHFTFLYDELRKLSKMGATTLEEKQEKLDKIMDVNNQINTFLNSLGGNVMVKKPY